MKTKTHRRTFLKQSAVLGGGLLLLGSKAQSSRAAGAETNPAGGAVAPANDTLKTIGSLRTIHGNFMDWWFKDWLGGSKPTEKETQMLRLLKRSGFVELQKA
jgi:hypothetical protein